MIRRMTSLLLLVVLGLIAPNAAEVPPDAARPCFPGAYYRKAVSSVDVWTGVELLVTLPRFVPDPARLRPNGRPTDNCSVYLGGRAGQTEIDAGVCWEVIREADGSVSTVGKAFRPFWRNKRWFSGPAKPEYYFNPGDTVRMKVWTESADKLRMQIDLIARAGEAVDPGREPISTLSVEFDAPGFAPGRKQEFKRVTAIDQSGNEGKPVQPTAARVEACRILATRLFRDGDPSPRPMTPDRFTDMRCPDPRFFQLTRVDGDGGEQISIDGGR